MPDFDLDVFAENAIQLREFADGYAQLCLTASIPPPTGA